MDKFRAISQALHYVSSPFITKVGNFESVFSLSSEKYTFMKRVVDKFRTPLNENITWVYFTCVFLTLGVLN